MGGFCQVDSVTRLQLVVRCMGGIPARTKDLTVQFSYENKLCAALDLLPETRGPMALMDVV